MRITQIEKTSIADVVYEHMLAMVADGSWPEGSKIPSENELKDLFGVSRNTVRQSIQKMNALGIVESRQGMGTFVKKVDTSFYLNSLLPTVMIDNDNKNSISILEFEKAIQVESVKIVVENATDEEIEGLKTFIDNMKEASDPEAFYNYDKEYHKYISEISHNTIFLKSMTIFKKMMKSGLVSVVRNYGRKESIEMHEAIYLKLKERNSEAAARLMDEHLQLNLNRLQKIEEGKKNDTQINESHGFDRSWNLGNPE